MRQQMESSPNIHVNVISAEALRFPAGAGGNKAFVVVATDSSRHRAMTTTNRDGGAYPSWNEKFNLPFPAGTRLIDVEVWCKTVVGDKMVGRSTIPVRDFIGVYSVPLGYLHFLSYRLIDTVGKRNGIINLSLQVMAWLPENLILQPPIQIRETFSSQPHPLPAKIVPSAPTLEESSGVAQPYDSFYVK